MGAEERPVLRVKYHVFLQSPAVMEAHSAHGAAEGPGPRVDIDVLQKPMLLSKVFTAVMAGVGPLASMGPQVAFQIEPVPEILPTFRAAVGLGVTPAVLSQILLGLEDMVAVEAAKHLKSPAVESLRRVSPDVVGATVWALLATALEIGGSQRPRLPLLWSRHISLRPFRGSRHICHVSQPKPLSTISCP